MNQSKGEISFVRNEVNGKHETILGNLADLRNDFSRRIEEVSGNISTFRAEFAETPAKAISETREAAKETARSEMLAGTEWQENREAGMQGIEESRQTSSPRQETRPLQASPSPGFGLARGRRSIFPERPRQLPSRKTHPETGT